MSSDSRRTPISRSPRHASPSGLLLGSPKPSALLDLSNPGERRVEAFMRWAATGESPLWSPLAVARRKTVLLVAVAWRNWPHSCGHPFGLVELSLTGEVLKWRSFSRRQRDQMMAMLPDAESATDTTNRFGDMLRYRRESAGLTRMELATAAKLSYRTVCNLEAGTTVPSLLTLACLRQVTALGQLTEPLAVSSSGVMNHDG